MAKLSKENIRDILTDHSRGVAEIELAVKFKVDQSTISYHVTKFRNSGIYDCNVYALIKTEVQHICKHPSTKCLGCGKIADTLFRDERLHIEQLERQLATAQATIERFSMENALLQ